MLREEELRRGVIPALLAVFALFALSCGNDLYSDCDPDDELNCDKGDSSYNCVAEPDFQCSTQVCAKYQNSRPFCTKGCTSDGDCQAGECKRFLLGRDDKYCVPDNKIDDESSSSSSSSN